jgi:hypothetical protein
MQRAKKIARASLYVFLRSYANLIAQQPTMRALSKVDCALIIGASADPKSARIRRLLKFMVVIVPRADASYFADKSLV